VLRFVIFLAGVMTVGTGSAEGVSPCPVDSIPIQIVGWPHYGDTGYSPRITLSANDSKMSNYRHVFPIFISTVTKHVAAQMGREKLCLDSAYSKERSLLQFLLMPFVPYGDRPLTPQPSLDVSPSGGCMISSPWIDLVIERKPVPWIRGIVRWNERQFLADQAMLDGIQNVPLGVAKQLTHSELHDIASELRHIVVKDENHLRHHPTGKPIEEIVPTDILWKVSRTGWRTRARAESPISVEESLAVFISQGVAEDKVEEGYIKLVLALVDRCFDSDGEALRYNSILDASELISLEQYKIAKPFRSKYLEREKEKLCARYKDPKPKYMLWCDLDLD